MMRYMILGVLVLCAQTFAFTQSVEAGETAKEIFGAEKLPAMMPPRAIGFYAKGCLAGGVALPTDGPTWQAMRLSRNRRWGHPDLIALIEKLSKDAAKYDGWPGLLVGDISQPRGGPMLSGHASHQIGLDVDIWFTPMPNHTLSARERETMAAASMLKKNTLYVDPNVWTQSRARLLMRAASYPQVERIFVHPGIKKELCETWKGNRSVMGKIRPYYGHYDHFHIRIKCPAGVSGCRSQNPPPAGDGCGKSLAWWFTKEPWTPAKPKNGTTKPKPKKRPIELSDLPAACATVVHAPAPASEAEVTFAAHPIAMRTKTGTNGANIARLPAHIPIPLPRPSN